MKIGIYIEAQGVTIGGSELSVAVLAEALSRSHQVEIVHQKSAFDKNELATHCGTDLSCVTLRHVAAEPQFIGYSSLPWRCYQKAQQWHASLSEPYDLFINFTHGLPPFCHAAKGVLMVLFPWFNRRSTWPWEVDGSSPRKRLRRFYYDWEWHKRFSSYQVKAANSKFTQAWAKRWWEIDCEVVYPPTGDNYRLADKKNIILSVGRFATVGHTKKQLEMATAFQQMQDTDLPGWEYFCVGGLSRSPQDIAYFEAVRSQATKGRAHVMANVEREKLRSLFEGAKIFWHAAGYNEPEDLHPELSEHFGIVTVEAMAAGCIPIVINKGGQPEIVEHGVSGFLWNTLDELREYTAVVAGDEELRSRMSEAARQRAQFFSREEYVNRSLKLLQPLLT